jgi:hypothetical protein
MIGDDDRISRQAQTPATLITGKLPGS